MYVDLNTSDERPTNIENQRNDNYQALRLLGKI
jgi:hypothetical protein